MKYNIKITVEDVESGSELTVTLEDVERDVILERNDPITSVMLQLEHYTQN